MATLEAANQVYSQVKDFSTVYFLVLGACAWRRWEHGWNAKLDSF